MITIIVPAETAKIPTKMSASIITATIRALCSPGYVYFEAEGGI